MKTNIDGALEELNKNYIFELTNIHGGGTFFDKNELIQSINDAENKIGQPWHRDDRVLLSACIELLTAFTEEGKNKTKRFREKVQQGFDIAIVEALLREYKDELERMNSYEKIRA